MSDVSVNIAFNSHFGTNGAGNGQFDYPTGITILNDEIYVVDKQNNRIQVFNLSGVYQRQFGSVGAGNDQFFFPEGITNDGTNVYIVDGGNHRIKKHQPDGTFLLEFGSNGTGNDEFYYPVGIAYDGTYLFIADKQNHRIKQHQTDGTYIFEFGTYGTGNTDLNFPEGVACFQSGLVVADSGNKKVKFFTISGGFIRVVSSYTFGYPVAIENISDEILIVTDKTNQSLVILDENAALVDEYGSEGTGDDQFYFPTASIYYSDHLYVVDSGNYRVKDTDFSYSVTTPVYADDFLKLSKQLYPTGRAFWLNRLNTFWKLEDAFSYSESRAYSASVDILDSILPDNDNFSAEDATNWESALGLIAAPTLSDRKAAILRAMRHPGNIPARQHYLYLEGQLQAAGFSVYVHENRFPDGSGGYEVYNPVPAIYGQANYGQTNYGASGLPAYTILANHVEESKDASFNMGNDVNFRNTLFIGGQIFPNAANVDADRKKEFRNLILKIKPAQTAVFLLINYV